MQDITVIPTEEPIREDISLRSLRDKPKEKPVEYKVEKKELSKNIQKFDKKPRVYTENPYSYNAVSLKKRPDVTPTQSAEELLTDPTYNTMGKVLGVDTVHDWNRYYNKIYAITEWAKLKSGETEVGKIIKWVTDQSRRIPNMGAKEIDSLYLHARLYLIK